MWFSFYAMNRWQIYIYTITHNWYIIHSGVVKVIIFKIWQFSVMYIQYDMPPLPTLSKISVKEVMGKVGMTSLCSKDVPQPPWQTSGLQSTSYAKDEFLLKFVWSYKAVNFYQMARYPTITKAMLPLTIFLDLLTPAQCLHWKMTRDVGRFARRLPLICDCQCKQWVPDVIEGTCELWSGLLDRNSLLLSSHVAQCCYCSIFFNTSPKIYLISHFVIS